jgi:DNA-binding NtrC family response regulator
MNVEDLDLRKVLSFSPKGGVIKLMGRRVLLLDTVAVGVLRRELITGLGVLAARNILTRIGYAHGWLAAQSLASEYPDLLQKPFVGPILHTLQGAIGNARDLNIEGDYRNGRFTCIWEDSYEAEQHLLQIGIADEPVCWAQTAYVSGYISRMTGREVYCIEHKCIGKGDAYCSIESRPKEEWGGAIDDHLLFFQKETIEEVLNDVTVKLSHAERRLSQLKRLFDDDIHPSGMVASSKGMRQVLDIAGRAAKVDSSVIITGESGVGKEMVARYIHDESFRAGRPFVAVNCNAVAETLLESEFFGHVKGAFSGAHNDRIGLFEAANGGTIFLDEIGDISLAMQAKLLRVLQEKEVRRIGENKSRSVDVKVVAATNRDLEEDVETGRFRQDLYYRLNVIELEVPPLRERKEDILPLARFFLEKAATRTGRSISGFSPEAVDLLLAYRWPGNVRELQNVVERSVVFCAGNTVDVAELPGALRKGSSRARGQNDIRTLEDMERIHILSALEKTNGDKRMAAEKLNIGLTSLYRRLKEYGMM